MSQTNPDTAAPARAGEPVGMQKIVPPNLRGPVEYKKGQLTRRGMQQSLAAGGSVLHKGRLITNEAELPNEEDVGAVSTEDLQVLDQDLERQQLELTQRRDRLRAKAEEQHRAASGKVADNDDDDDPGEPEPEPVFGDAKIPLSQLVGKTDEELLAIPGIGQGNLKKIRQFQADQAK